APPTGWCPPHDIAARRSGSPRRRATGAGCRRRSRRGTCPHRTAGWQQTRSKAAEANCAIGSTMQTMAGGDPRTMLAAIAAGVVAAMSRPAVASAARAPVGVLTRLPGNGNQLALTVDDGVSSAVVGAFGQFCRDTGTRLTFFVNGVNPSWSDNAAA